MKNIQLRSLFGAETGNSVKGCGVIFLHAFLAYYPQTQNKSICGKVFAIPIIHRLFPKPNRSCLIYQAP